MTTLTLRPRDREATVAITPRWIIEHREMSPQSKVLWGELQIMAYDCGGSDVVSIRHDDISASLGIGVTTVKRCIQDLRDCEALLVEHETSGRGREQNTYYLASTRKPENGLSDSPKMAYRDSPKMAYPPYSKKERKDIVEPNGSTVAVEEEIIDLCEHLAVRIAKHHDSAKPLVTPRWTTAMRRLRDLGPPELVNEPTPVDHIEQCIDFIFDHLNESRGGFCWADVIRSPDNLRKSWPKLITERKKFKDAGLHVSEHWQ